MEGLFHVCRCHGHFHAATTAASCGFDDDRIADFFTNALCISKLFDTAARAGHARHAELFHRLNGADLIAHDADVVGCWADERQAVVLHGLHEGCVFRQKAIAGVDRLRASDFTGGNNRRKRQIRLGAGWRSNADSFISHADMHRVGVGRRMHSHGLDTHFTAGTDHPQGNFTAVGN